MNILCSADWHLTVAQPKRRLDVFPETQEGKIDWILETARRRKCRAVVLAGDLTDHPKLPYHITRKYMSKFRRLTINLMMEPDPAIPIYAVMGQHDLRYHTNPMNTPFATICAGAGLILLNDQPEEINPIDDGCYFYGYSWNDKDYPQVRRKQENTCHILVAHKMVIEDERLWDGQENYVSATNLLRTLPDFDLIITGDNHLTFTANTENRALINPGSIMRWKKDQIDHKPCVFIVDTDTLHWDIEYIPIEPASKVFDLGKMAEDEEKGKRMSAWIETLEKGTDMPDLKFVENLKIYIKANKVEPGVIGLMEEATGEYLSGKRRFRAARSVDPGS